MADFDGYDNDIVELELTPKLKQNGIVSSFAIRRRINSIVLSLNHEYEGKMIVFSIDKSNWSKTIANFEKRLKQKGISEEHIRQLGDVLDNNFDRILNFEYSVDIDGDLSNNDNVIVVNNPEEWHTKLVEKYQNLYNVVQKNLPNLWPSLEFELSIKNILNIKDCSLPFGGIVLGKPSSLKTVGIELFRESRHTFYTDSFSARSFVSHNSGVSEEQLEEIDLLPKIRNKCFLTPELAPTFASKDEDLIQVVGIMTRILDGHGYESDSGAHGHRGYNEHMMFTWIGAAVDIPFKIHKLLTSLGPRLYFFRVPKVQSKSDDDYYEQMSNDDFNDKVDEIGQALSDYQNWFDRGPEMVNDDMFGSTIRKMPWNSRENHKQAYMHIIKLARLLSHLRGVVPTWHTQDTQGSDYAYGLPIIEEPDRAMQQLVNLARGHALLTGRNYVTVQDLPLIVKVVLSTAPMERVSIFDLLLANGGKLTTSRIEEFLNVSKPTALRTMTELKALGLVDMKKEEVLCDDGITRDTLVIILKEQFNWFLSNDFKTLREGFNPEDNNNNNDNNNDNDDGDDNGSNSNDKGGRPGTDWNNLLVNNPPKEKYPPPTNKNQSLLDIDEGNTDNDKNNTPRGGKISLRAVIPHKNDIEESCSSNWSKSTIYRTYPGSDTFACYNCKVTGDKFFMQKHVCSMSRKKKRN